MTPEASDCDARIRKLERRLGFLLAFVGVLCLAVATGFPGPVRAGASPPDEAATPTRVLPADSVLTLRGLVIVDETGQERVRVGTALPDPLLLGKRSARGGDVAGILLFDAEGNERGGYVTGPRSAALTLDELGRAAIHLGVGDRGDIHLQMSDGQGGFAGMGITPETSYLQVAGQGENVTLSTADSSDAAASAGSAGDADSTTSSDAALVDSLPPSHSVEAADLGLTAVRYSSDGELLAWSSLDGTVEVLTADDLSVIASFDHGAEVYDIEFADEGRIVSTGNDGRLVAWDVAAGTMADTLRLEGRSLDLDVMPTGEIVALDLSGMLTFWDLSTGSVQRRLEVRGSLSVAVHPSGDEIATGPPVRLWRSSDGEQVGASRHYGGGDLAFSHRGDLLAAGLLTTGAAVFQLADWEDATTLHEEVTRRVYQPGGFSAVQARMPVLSVAFSRDGRWLATGGGAMRVELRRVPDGVVPADPSLVLIGPEASVASIDFSPDDRHVVAGSLDGRLTIWEIPAAETG